jgi:hypothetical protein
MSDQELNKSGKKRSEADLEKGRGYITESAKVHALIGLTAEIARELGIDPEHFNRVFAQRVEFERRVLLENMENIAPDLAAQLDQQSSDEISVDPPAPLFEPPATDSDKT